VILRIADDGRGIRDHDMQRSGHYGILGMRERIDALGGTLHIARRQNGGTIVEARVPIEC
jgi:signal transduction histidine kinase